MFQKKTFKVCDEALLNLEKLVTEMDYNRKKRVFHTKNSECESICTYDKKGNCIISIKAYKLIFGENSITVIQKINSEYDKCGSKIHEKEIITRNSIDDSEYFFHS